MSEADAEQGAEAAATRRLGDALSDPAAWAALGPEARAEPGTIRILRTHGAVLGFAGSRVLKVKRPVDLGFFDFRDPERRRHFCCEEVRLNRRLAGPIYLGVSPIIEDAAGRLRAGEPREPEASRPTGAACDGGTVVDHAVAMVRLPDAGMLSARLAAGTLRDVDIDRIARRIARFHAEARRGPAVDRLADPRRVRREFLENADQLAERLVGSSAAVRRAAAACPPARVARVRAWLDRTLAAMTPVLEARIAAGRACEGHGDLHGGNICLLGDREQDVVAFDCIEFEEAFRCGDPARELGFLAMDLEARDAPEAADALLRSYAEAADDPDLPDLVAPFLVHYALVRAKVDAITAADHEHDADPSRRDRCLADLERYGEIAAIRTLGPVVVLMCGLPGTGKSRLAATIAARLRARWIRSDVERKRLHGIEPTDRTPESRRAEVYGPGATRRTYAELARQATSAVGRGGSVVLDATYARRADRAEVIAAVTAAGGRWILVHADPPASVVREWLEQRAGESGVVSDADQAVHEQARSVFEPPTELDSSRVLHLTDPRRQGPRVAGRLIERLEAAADGPSSV